MADSLLIHNRHIAALSHISGAYEVHPRDFFIRPEVHSRNGGVPAESKVGNPQAPYFA